ncbi:MAG: GMC family oxidoreductase [Deltaproteobacteria bacterium]|nr:GMC family oxidoreductase [Deltaproteobacteria bacterium]
MNLNPRTHYDLIVVGSGPSGATVAREMAISDKKVLLLEWGDNKPVKGTKLQALSNTAIPGKSFFITKDMLGVTRGLTTGGSSVYYYATAFEPPVHVFKSYGIDLKNEIESVKRELPIKPLQDSFIGPNAKTLMNSAKSLGYDWQKLPKFIDTEKCKINCWKCTYGCPHGAKWNARMYVEDGIKNGLELITGAKVRKAIIEKNKAVGIEYRKSGKDYKVFADKIVISAGGIGSPLILKETGIENVGTDFFFDPLISVMGTLPGLNGGREIPMAGGMHMEEDGYMMTDMAIPQMLYMGFTAQVFRFHKLFSHKNTLQIMIKAKDELGGNIGRNGGVHKSLTKRDRQKLMKGYKVAEKILKNAGAKDIFKSWYLAAHPGGTAKINEVVDKNLKTTFDNLYVCDCSVIPESWGLPPTLTLLALGKRLSNHLREISNN